MASPPSALLPIGAGLAPTPSTNGDGALGELLFLHDEGQALAHVGTWVTFLDGSDRLDWSKEARRIFGFDARGEATVATYLAHVHPDDRDRVLALRAEAIAHGTPYDIEYRIVRTDGEVRTIHARATIVGEGANRRLIGVFQDVTEARRLVDELRASDARYRRILETTTEGVWLIDDEHRTSFVNPRMAAMLGYAPREMLGRSVFDFLLPEFHALTRERLARRREGATAQVEVAYRKKDGSALWALVDAAPVFDEQGRFEGTLGMISDVTDRRRAEEALRKSEEQLRQAQKMEAIGRLAGGVAHDFNNLLSVIIGYTSAILGTLKEVDPLAADLREVLRAGERAAALTRQLLAFSRQQVLEPRILDLNETLAATEKMIRRVLGEDVELSLELARPLGMVNADPGQIEQVLLNLVVNARDAMPMGGRLVVRTADATIDEPRAAEQLGLRPGAYVKMSVIDDGFGMDAATRARIFEPFFTTKGKDKGTGLGLSTVLGIVQQSGGNVTVASEPGRGTTFDVYLPRASTRSADLSTPPPPPVSLRGTETIMVVEDEAPVRALAATVLRRNGYQVVEAQNGGEAILLCEDSAQRIDLVLTDVVLPRLSGRKVVERLLALRPELKVLYVSGYPDASISPLGILHEGIALLHKPLRPDALLAKVRDTLDS